MAVLDFVRVAVDGVGKRIHNVLHALGGPDGDRYQQIIGIGDPDVAADIAKVRNAIPAVTDHGVVTREAPPSKDSGLVAVALGTLGPVPNLSSGDVKVRHIFLNNPAGGTALITILDITNSRAYIGPDFPLPARSHISVPMGGVLAAGGLQWQTKNQNANGQILAD